MASVHSQLGTYIEKFANLRKDKNRNRYPAKTRYAASHKPLLLLAIIDLFAEGSVEENQILLTPELCDLFDRYWQSAGSNDARGDIAMPFYHLTGDGFWHLIPQPGSENVLESGRRLRSIRLLHDHTQGARLDDVLFELLIENESRDLLRSELIVTHFAPDLHEVLVEIGTINVESYKYSERLLHQARGSQNDEVSEGVDIPDPVRDQGFRRAIVQAYDHRCAISGIRILTVDYHTAVDAAHIKPWSISHDDSPRNGIALSKLCHWAFEEGLLTITPDYSIVLSRELTASYNTPGQLGTLHGRSIHLPDDEKLRPGAKYLQWHRDKKFRG